VAEVFTRRMSRWQAEQQREAVADVYVEAYRGVAGEEFRDRVDFLRRFADATQRPGFDMVVASERRMTGAAFGFVLDRADGWWRDFTGDPPPGLDLEELTASGQVFALAELMVVPAYRAQGIATRLLDALLLRSDAALVTALVGHDSAPAHQTLRAWGWNRLGDVRPTPDAPAVQAWARTLR
jgi:GNAT superfamily N-acetyltransferase